LWFGHAAQWPRRIHPAHLVPVLLSDLKLAGIAVLALGAAAVAVTGVRRHVSAGPVAVAGEASRHFRVLLPETFDRAALPGFFCTVSELLRPVLFGGQRSVTFTATAAGQRFQVELDCHPDLAEPVVAGLEAAIDGIAIDELPARDPKADRRLWARCTLRPTGSRWLPLESKHPVDPARQVLAMLGSKNNSDWACVQFVCSPLTRRARRRGRREARRLRTGNQGGALGTLGSVARDLANESLDIFTPGSPTPQTRTATPQYVPSRWTVKQANAIEEKTAEPLLAATVRVAVSGGRRRVLRWRLHALTSSFAQFHSLGGLRAGRELFGRRRFERRLPALRPPLVLTAAEAAALLPLPTRLTETRLVLAEAPARRLPPTADAPQSGIRLGTAEQ
jgi:hypothetical protein